MSSLLVPISVIISHTVLMILVLIPLLFSTCSLSYICPISLLIALSTSFTTLLLSYYFPTHSPIFLFLLMFFLQSSLPLPSPLGTMLALLVLIVHISMVITIQPIIYTTIRIELVSCPSSIMMKVLQSFTI